MGDLILTGLYTKFADAIAETLNEAKARGLKVGLHSGLRTFEAQDKLYELGRSVVNPDGSTAANPRGNVITKTIGGYSWHNYGLAGDLVFKNDKGWTWDMTTAQWEELGKVGEMFGLEWGGRWTRFPDFPHFQMIGKLKGRKFEELKAVALKDGIDAVWKGI